MCFHDFAILICMLHVPLPRCSKVTPCSPVPRAPSADENTPRRPTPGQWSLRRGHLYFLLWRPLTKQGSQHEQGSECREGELQRSSEYKITGHQYADETLQPREEKHGRICIWICLYVHVCRGSLKESMREKRRERERERVILNSPTVSLHWCEIWDRRISARVSEKSLHSSLSLSDHPFLVFP